MGKNNGDIDDKLTYEIIGCAMEVHKTLGPGFQEVIYQRCMAIELKNAGLAFSREQEQIVYYKGVEVGSRRADFIVEENVVLEMKALCSWRMFTLHRQKTIPSLMITRRVF